jgi:GrpB-like predicted nucleotidyltransferase (UPF0157 family)
MPGPVVIVDYDPLWPRLYEELRAAVCAVLGDQLVAIEHIGSTSVPGLAAKPIVDIMGGVRQLRDVEACIEPLVAIRFWFVPRAMELLPDDRYFERWTEDFEVGQEIAHLHLTEFGGEFWERHIRFRDRLRTQPETAAAYARHKRELARVHTSVDYTWAKTAFIRTVLIADVGTDDR